MLRTADPTCPWNKDTQGRDLTRNTAVRPNNPNERNTSNLFQKHLTCTKLTWPHPGWPLTAVGTVQYGLQLFSSELYLSAGVKMWWGAKLQKHDERRQPVRASAWRRRVNHNPSKWDWGKSEYLDSQVSRANCYWMSGHLAMFLQQRSPKTASSGP